MLKDESLGNWLACYCKMWIREKALGHLEIIGFIEVISDQPLLIWLTSDCHNKSNWFSFSLSFYSMKRHSKYSYVNDWQWTAIRRTSYSRYLTLPSNFSRIRWIKHERHDVLPLFLFYPTKTCNLLIKLPTWVSGKQISNLLS